MDARGGVLPGPLAVCVGGALGDKSVCEYSGGMDDGRELKVSPVHSLAGVAAGSAVMVEAEWFLAFWLAAVRNAFWETGACARTRAPAAVTVTGS